MNKEEIRQFKSLLRQGSLRHMNIILDDKFQKSLLEIIKDYEQKDKQLEQLTNNWNELEEYIEKENSKYIPTDPYIDGTNATYEEILDKMKEIKGDNNENIQ